MRRLSEIVLALALVLSASSAPFSGSLATVRAQRLNIRAYDNRSGLPQQQVLAAFQGADGYLWFGTYAGLSRFNGRTFRTYTTEDGLASHIVDCIAGDADGRLVIGTRDGLCFFDGVAFDCIGVEEGLPDADVSDILVEGDEIWVATAGGVARVTAGAVRAYTGADGLPSATTLALARGPDGRLWVGTGSGLASLVGDRFVPFPGGVPGGERVPVLELSSDGMLVGSGSGLYLLRDDRLEPVPLPPMASRPIFSGSAVGPSGEVWVVGEQLGALRYRSGRTERLTVANGLPTHQLYSALVDRESSVWFGSADGAIQYVPGPITAYGTDDGLPNGVVRAIAEDGEGRLWLGTRAGVAVYDGERFRIPVPVAALPDPRVYALAPAPGGGMLIGTNNGLVLWDGSVRAAYGRADGLHDGRIRSLLRDPAGGVWVGTRGQLARWDDGSITAFPDSSPLAGLDPLDMRYDLGGRLWMGLASGGLAVLDGQDLTSLGAAQGLTDQVVWSIDRDAQGRMWVGTNGDGAFRVDPADGSVLHLTAGDGLVNNFVWSVLCDSRGWVWMYTNQGLVRYTDGEFRLYGVAAGLTDLEGNATAAWETADGSLWFGAGSGVVRFDPDADRGNDVPPAVVVDEVRGPGGVLPAGDALPARFSGLTITFAGLSYRSPERVRYRYRLRGLSRAWSPPTSEASVQYAGLGPGTYEFQVTAMNEDGLWTEDAASFTFTVAPAFWQAWWFRVLAAAAFLGVIAAVVQGTLIVRTHRLESERRRLAERVWRNTEELRKKNVSLQREMEHRKEAEERLLQSQKLEAVGRLAGGVAHDFNNVMTTIIGFSELIEAELGDSEGAQDELAEIKKAAQHAAKLTKQLLTFSRKDLIRPRTLDLNEVVEHSTRMLKRLIGEDVILETSLAPDLGRVRADRGQLEQILVNLAVNARDAITDGGRLTIATANVEIDDPVVAHDGEAAQGRFVSLSVADTGPGIDPDAREHIFEPFYTTKQVGEGTGLGLATVYGIVKQNHGHVFVESEPGAGATFTILLPPLPAAPGDAADGA